MEKTVIPLIKQDFRGRMEAVATVAGCRAFFPHLSAFALMAISAFPVTVSASWLATGPYGGDADIVRAVPEGKGYVIAAARNGLIFSSVNGAASWTNLPFPAQFSGVLHALEIDPKSPKTWYAGVESDMSRVSGVYKTTDAGATWTQLPGTVGIGVWSLAIWPGDDQVIAAGTSTGVFLTRDAGAAWKKISPADDTEIRPVVSLAFHPGDSKILYAGTTHLPWKTDNGGATWESIHTGMIDDSDVFSIQVDAKNPEHVMASACSGVYNSVDGAKHWTKMDTPTGAFRTHFVALDPRHEGVVFAGTTEGLLKSANGGHLWRKVSASSVRALAFDPGLDGRIFFAASGGTTQGGLMVSTDEGSSLHESNAGFTNRNFTTLSGAGLSLYSSSVYEAGTGGAYRTDNLAARWEHAGGPAGDELVQMATAPDDPKHLYAAGYHGISESRDGGTRWTARKVTPDGYPAVALMPFSNGVLLAGTTSGLFRTDSSGAWTKVSGQRNTQSLQRSPGNVVAALTTNGALVSSDEGVTWTACGDSGVRGSWYGLAFDMLPKPQPGIGSHGAVSAVALAATPAGLFRSVDGCRTWTQVHEGLGNQTVSLVIFHPTRAGVAFLSQGGRIFVSTDGGQRWQPIDDEAGSNAGPASLIVLSAAPDTLFALFPRRGVYTTGIGMWLAPTDKTTVGVNASVAARPRND